MKVLKYFGLSGIVVMLLLMSSCGLYNQARELERFAQSKFSVNSVVVDSISGVDLSKIKQFSDLNFKEIMMLSQGLLSGNLPAKVRLNIEVSNPSARKAAVSGMDWKLFQKQQEIASGQLNKRVDVKGHGSTTFDLKADVNLAAVFKLNSVNQILNIMSGNLDSKTLQELQLTIQLKPYYKLGNKIKKYPDYLTITPNFGQEK